MAEINAYCRAFGYKRRKTPTIVHMRKNVQKEKKKKKMVVSLKVVFSRGIWFSRTANNVEHLWGMESMGLLMRSWSILSHTCRGPTSGRAALPSKLVVGRCQDLWHFPRMVTSYSGHSKICKMSKTGNFRIFTQTLLSYHLHIKERKNSLVAPPIANCLQKSYQCYRLL